jgi:hypothetical protein
MGVSWSDDIDPIGVLGSRPGPAAKPGPVPQPDSPGPLAGPHHHHRRRRSGVLARPQAAAAAITTLLARHPQAHRRAYRRYWV